MIYIYSKCLSITMSYYAIFSLLSSSKSPHYRSLIMLKILHVIYKYLYIHDTYIYRLRFICCAMGLDLCGSSSCHHQEHLDVHLLDSLDQHLCTPHDDYDAYDHDDDDDLVKDYM
ncbi:hypothetical protein R6Q59_007343 [Mikania micrantha]